MLARGSGRKLSHSRTSLSRGSPFWSHAGDSFRRTESGIDNIGSSQKASGADNRLAMGDERRPEQSEEDCSASTSWSGAVDALLKS
jgi:hypothetical protein